MIGANFSVPIAMKEPTDYSKAWDSGQRQYNHQNDCSDSTTLLKLTCYIGDTGQTDIVIRNTNLMDMNALKMTCIILYLKNIMLGYMPANKIPVDIAIASTGLQVYNHQTLQQSPPAPAPITDLVQYIKSRPTYIT